MAGKKADDSQMNTTDSIECPICAKSFKQSLINRHVNDCLLNAGIDDSQHVSPIHTRKRKSSYDSPSKKSSSASDFGKPEDSKTAWGSLKPLSPQSNVSTNKKRKLTTTPGPKSNTKQDTLGRSPKSPFSFSSSNSTVAGTHEDAKAVVVTAKSPTKKSPKTTPRKTVTKNLGVSTSGTLDFCLEGANPAPISSCENETKTQTVFTNSNSTSNLPCVEFDFSVPLAEKVRPTTLDEYIGQKQAVGKKSPLCSLLGSNEIPSMILWGPPGCGKTTLAKIIAKSCKDKGKYKFTCMSATSAGVNDVKEAVKIAKNDLRMFHRNTIIFLDEIHRFNKLQQDALLPHVEDGTIVLIGATTENPSFQVNSALLSRCKVIVLEKLEVGEVERVLKRALDILGIKVFTKKTNIKNKDGSSVWMEEEAVTTLAGLCDGDARCALNSLQMAIQSQVSTLKSTTAKSNNQGSIGKAENVVIIDKEIIKEGLQRSHILYDRAGEEHYNIISALHKSMRGSDENAALYWLARMLEGGETPLYIARRLVRFASEDIGLADPHALNLAVSTYQACHFLGMPECDVILAQCAVYMARASKSVEVYKAYSKAKAFVRNHKGPMPGVPLHLRNAPTKLMKSIGYGKNYKYNPNFQEPEDQEYLPPEFKGVNFFS